MGAWCFEGTGWGERTWQVQQLTSFSFKKRRRAISHQAGLARMFDPAKFQGWKTVASGCSIERSGGVLHSYPGGYLLEVWIRRCGL